MRSDLSQYSISNTGQSHQPVLNSYHRPIYSGLFNDSSNQSHQMRRPSLGPVPNSRTSFDQAGMQPHVSLGSGRCSASGLLGQASPPIWNLQPTNGGFTGDTSSYANEGFPPFNSSSVMQTASSSDFNTNITADSTFGMSPLTRQLPQPSSRGTGPRGSLSSYQGAYHSAGLHSGYPNENYDLERVFSETSQGSMTSASQGAGSTTSPSPKETHMTSFGCTSVSQSPSEIVNASLGDYQTTAATVDPGCSFFTTSAAAGARSQRGSRDMPIVSPYHDSFESNQNSRRTSGARSESSNSEYTSSYRMLQPQPGFRPISKAPTYERR